MQQLCVPGVIITMCILDTHGIMNADSMGTSNVYLVSPLGLQCVSKVHEVL